jgi:hypothetical protein
VDDFEQYLGLSPAEAFPEPPPITDLRVKRTLLDRKINTTTLSWKSAHEVICPRYRKRHEGEYRKNLVAWARWIRPDGKSRRSCLVYVHGWLEPGSWAEESTLFRKWTRVLGGDIGDEHDVDEASFILKHSESSYTVKALTPIEDFNEFFDARLSDEEFDTIGGLVTNVFGYLPRRGESITLGDYRFQVLRADNRRVHLLHVTPLPAPVTASE